MADTVDPTVSSSPADDVEESQGASPADEAEQPGDARSPGPEVEGEEPGDARSAGPEGEAEERDEDAEDDRSVTELLEQLGRDLGDLGMSEAQLEAARNLPGVRRSVRDIVGALVAVVAMLTGFAFLNVAAMHGLSRVLATWLAPLVLGAAWIAIGGVIFLCIRRARRWLSWLFLKAPTEATKELERERDGAAKAARNTLESLGPALATQIALAAVPKAADVASGVADVGDSVLDASNETVGVIADQIPGRDVASQVWSVALMPGRLGIRVATIVLGRGRPEDGA